MSEDKARLERTVGIPLKEKSSPDRLGRRAFGRVALAGIVTLAGYNLFRTLEKRQEDGDLFSDGFPGLYRGIIHVRQGAVIYDRPATWVRSERDRLVTTNTREETVIETIDEGEEFTVSNPVLFLRPPNQFSIPESVFRVGQPGREREMDLNASYVIFEAERGMPESVVRSINVSTTKWGCINMSVPNTLGYQPNGESDFRFGFTPQAVIFK